MVEATRPTPHACREGTGAGRRRRQAVQQRGRLRHLAEWLGTVEGPAASDYERLTPSIPELLAMRTSSGYSPRWLWSMFSENPTGAVECNGPDSIAARPRIAACAAPIDPSSPALRTFRRSRSAGRFSDQESRLILDQAIVMGRGGVFLNLTEEQYAKLEAPCLNMVTETMITGSLSAFQTCDVIECKCSKNHRVAVHSTSRQGAVSPLKSIWALQLHLYLYLRSWRMFGLAKEPFLWRSFWRPPCEDRHLPHHGFELCRAKSCTERSPLHATHCRGGTAGAKIYVHLSMI